MINSQLNPIYSWWYIGNKKTHFQTIDSYESQSVSPNLFPFPQPPRNQSQKAQTSVALKHLQVAPVAPG